MKFTEETLEKAVIEVRAIINKIKCPLRSLLNKNFEIDKDLIFYFPMACLREGSLGYQRLFVEIKAIIRAWIVFFPILD